MKMEGSFDFTNNTRINSSVESECATCNNSASDTNTTIAVNIIGPAFITQNILGVGIVLANITILITLSKCTLADKTMHDLFRSLAIADLMLGLATLLRQTVVGIYGKDVADFPLRCAPSVMLYVLSGGCSVSSLLFVSIEQWYTASRPLNVEQKKKQRRIMGRCVRSSWMFWSFLALCCLPATKPSDSFTRAGLPCLVTGPYIYTAYWQLSLNLLSILSIITLLFQFLCMRNTRAVFKRLMTAVEQRHQPFMISWAGDTTGNGSRRTRGAGSQIYQVSTTHRGENINNILPTDSHLRVSVGHYMTGHELTIMSEGSPGGDNHELYLAKKRMSLTKTLTLVMVLFAGSWLMYLPAVTAVSLCHSSLCDSLRHRIAYVGILPVLNSLMNAIVYPMRMRLYRKTMLKLFCPCIKPTNKTYPDLGNTLRVRNIDEGGPTRTNNSENEARI